ncbi:hypothetical protein [Pseudobacteriovorax antillogorgiicola]|uniref:Uncharacterized protein n=1 Tax=Pseudobacteriovorax antillogorgiicola TaxID=1513793 RepID=A0A1Y6CU17_9BACT|nr:hypothetical protein [Pseudobacteriovorax antillogorgiicola]TCS44393.1 hypothetical protein EDD56_13320 [Pseudobacteriovorax antillogorgiicola]SMF79313.1 hypothetical protein SAMN06296036_13354 [Pseudobacteriovorax antillogorgiicola]
MKLKKIHLDHEDMKRLVAIARDVEQETQELSDAELEQDVEHELRRLVGGAESNPVVHFKSKKNHRRTVALTGLLSAAAVLCFLMIPQVDNQPHGVQGYLGYKSGTTGQSLSDGCELHAWQDGELSKLTANAVNQLQAKANVAFVGFCEFDPAFLSLRWTQGAETKTILNLQVKPGSKEPVLFGDDALAPVPTEIEVIWTQQAIDEFQGPGVKLSLSFERGRP